MSSRTVSLHADWLSLVEPEGQFLSLPVLKRAFPDGLGAIPTAIREQLRDRYPHDVAPLQTQWDAWIDWLLRDVLSWGPYYRTGEDVAAYVHAVPEQGIVLRADAALCDPQTDKPRVLVTRYPHGTPLDRRLAGERWNASPIDRMILLSRAQGVRIGLLTDGESIILIWVPTAGVGGFATWDTALFTESRERNLLQSFTSLLHASRFFAVQNDLQLEALFEASEKAQNEVTGQLGLQVRQAVELLVAALSRTDLERGGALLAGVAPQTVYEAAATIMMRLVFLLYAEERDLLPLADPLYADCYAASTLREQLDDQAAMEGDEPLERRGAAWYRLLALFRVIYGGLSHDRLRLPPYGGRLFDPDRFAFLEGRSIGESWTDTASRPLPVDDLTVRAILEAIQTLPIREAGSRERRRLSFRSLDVEQIGHVYEGLLDHGAVRVDDLYVGLVGTTGDEAEIPLVDLEEAAQRGTQPLVSFLHDFTGKSESAVEKLIERGRAVARGEDSEARRLVNTVCDNNASLATRVAPFVYALRTDLHGLPVVFAPKSLVVKATRDRRDSGTEYTPRELAEDMVRQAMQPLVYHPGPADGLEPGQWKLRSSAELLNLKICDPAVGSGAFLVSACRYLSDRVVEAWISEDPGREYDSRDNLTLDARRAVVDRCLYGVDRDSMAVEMAKLSLWLITMGRERPFNFLDHAIREGDSLIGVTSLDQIRFLHIDPAVGKLAHAKTINDITRIVQPLIDQAVLLRHEMESLPNNTVRDMENKRRLNDEANRHLNLLQVIGDGLVATAISTVREGKAKYEKAFQGYGSLVGAALDGRHSEDQRHSALEGLRSRSAQLLNIGRSEKSPIRRSLHWPLAFPEVFSDQKCGFDAIVGNPPFLGNRLWKGAYGEALQGIVQVVLGMAPGKIDLCAAFHRRAVDLLRQKGNYSLLATSNIAEGSAIAVGLGEVVKAGDIFFSRKGVPWPNKAAVFVAIICFHKGAWIGAKDADGESCTRIGPRLECENVALRQPEPLRHGIFGFEGVNNSQGLAFLLNAESSWFEDLKSEPGSLLVPYVTGDDITSYALQRTDRWALDVADRDIEEIERSWPVAYRFLQEVVRPTRTAQVLRSYPGLHKRWWQFWNHRADLMRRLRLRPEVIVYSKNTKYPVCMLAPSGWIYTNKVLLIGAERADMFAIALSTCFRSWLEKYSGGNLGVTLNLSISKSVITFPLPSEIVASEGIAAANRFNQIAGKWAADRASGLTEVVNAIHRKESVDAEIVHLRQLLETVDHAVCAAYGWSDVDLAYGFRLASEGQRWMPGSETIDELIKRLLNRNFQSHAEQEMNNGVADLRYAKTRTRKEGALALAQLAINLGDGND